MWVVVMMMMVVWVVEDEFVSNAHESAAEGAFEVFFVENFVGSSNRYRHGVEEKHMVTTACFAQVVCSDDHGATGCHLIVDELQDDRLRRYVEVGHRFVE